MNPKAGNLMKSFALFAARRSNTGEITISTRDFVVLFIAGFLPWYILVFGVSYYLFWRYPGYLDAKENVRRELGLNREGEGSHDIQR
jgi:hypothetical protein